MSQDKINHKTVLKSNICFWFSLILKAGSASVCLLAALLMVLGEVSPEITAKSVGLLLNLVIPQAEQLDKDSSTQIDKLMKKLEIEKKKAGYESDFDENNTKLRSNI